jgi:leader peptidase (prepilin peptidase)/N-methyltransferase
MIIHRGYTVRPFSSSVSLKIPHLAGASDLNLVTIAIAGLAVGFGLSWWLEPICRSERQLMHWPAVSSRARWGRCAILMTITTVLFVAYISAAADLRVQDIDEVQPTAEGRFLRLVYHLVLISLLVLATAADFDCYIIPDQITIPGMALGLVGAFAVGEVQLCHLWVDWSIAVPQLRGPLIPAWFDPHRNWHGLAISSAGLITGAVVTWIAREISSRVLGQQAMGFGDVTLMAMIGSFLGWQAAILVFLLAPIAGLTVGVMIRLLTGKTYLPYGPWLSLAAFFVLFRWKWIWEHIRLIFSDWLGLSILAGIGGIGFVVLLGLVRLYRAIPVHKRD